MLVFCLDHVPLSSPVRNAPLVLHFRTWYRLCQSTTQFSSHHSLCEEPHPITSLLSAIYWHSTFPMFLLSLFSAWALDPSNIHSTKPLHIWIIPLDCNLSCPWSYEVPERRNAIYRGFFFCAVRELTNAHSANLPHHHILSVSAYAAVSWQKSKILQGRTYDFWYFSTLCSHIVFHNKMPLNISWWY